jgi:hypothetical protein
VTRALNPVEKNAERVTKDLRRQAAELNWRGVRFPVQLSDLSKVERLNHLKINVFGTEGKKFYPLRISRAETGFQIDLLLISDGEKKHYCLIKDKSRLLRSQVTKHEESIIFCDRCLNHFSSEEGLKNREFYCVNNEAVRIEMPGDSKTHIKFNNHNRSIKVPFAVYADFESILIPTRDLSDSAMAVAEGEKRSFTNKYQKRQPCGFGYKIVCSVDEKYSKDYVGYRGQDAARKFIESLSEDIRRIHREFDFEKEMIFSERDRRHFLKAKRCWICKGEFGSEMKVRDAVRDHCHFTGKYRGAAHSLCNLRFKKPEFTPVFFHNLANYDSHLFIKELGKTEGDLSCIPNNEEKYISFSKMIEVGTYRKEGKVKKKFHELRFVDSLKFMSAPLGDLVKNLKDEDFRGMKKVFGEVKLKLLARKGVYPYDYMDSLERFRET